jgi:hypothetical protein
VLLHQVRRLYPDVPAVFVDTGLEFPEIRKFVRTIDNVVWLRPKMPFNKVIEKYGYPLISKRVAYYISQIRTVTGKNDALIQLRKTGFKKDGTFCACGKIPYKWQSLAKAPFKISGECCSVMKKKPLSTYFKDTGRYPLIGTMASDSMVRELDYLRYGCTILDSGRPKSTPMSFWKEADVWGYIKKHNVPYSNIYDMGYSRTGCVFCMFGVHLESTPNRFQLLKKTHPKLWDYCIYKLNIKQCLDYIGVPYGEYYKQLNMLYGIESMK